MRDTEHHLFYSREIIGSDIGGCIMLDESETNHALSVLRIKEGEKIQITDGNGTVCECEYSQRLKKNISCRILNKTVIPKVTPRLTLLIGIPDKEPFETVLEHAAALGVSRIVPLVMDHCRKPWWESWEKVMPRFTAKMIVSMKQSLYPYIPQLDKPTCLADVIGECSNSLIAADQHGVDLQDEVLTQQSEHFCLVGPPGGLSVKENETLKSYNVQSVKIARQRLRTELAATVLCSRIMMAFL